MKNNDLVLRLRDDQTIAETLPRWSCDNLQATMHAAANVIESLEAEVERLRKFRAIVEEFAEHDDPSVKYPAREALEENNS